MSEIIDEYLSGQPIEDRRQLKRHLARTVLKTEQALAESDSGMMQIGVDAALALEIYELDDARRLAKRINQYLDVN